MPTTEYTADADLVMLTAGPFQLAMAADMVLGLDLRGAVPTVDLFDHLRLADRPTQRRRIRMRGAVEWDLLAGTSVHVERLDSGRLQPVPHWLKPLFESGGFRYLVRQEEGFALMFDGRILEPR